MEKTVGTLKEGALFGAGAIAGAWMLDRDKFFAKQLASDPNFQNGMVYQHWGAIVAVGAAWCSTTINNPLIKAGLIGVTIYGLLVEARNDFGWDMTVSPPAQRWAMMGPQDMNKAAQLDAQLRAAAQARMTAGPITQFYSGVGRITQGYSGVGGNGAPMGAFAPMGRKRTGRYGSGVGL